jgi:hypothetical protein
MTPHCLGVDGESFARARSFHGTRQAASRHAKGPTACCLSFWLEAALNAVSGDSTMAVRGMAVIPGRTASPSETSGQAGVNALGAIQRCGAIRPAA